MEHDFSILWNPTSGLFKVFDCGSSFSFLSPLKPLSIVIRDDGFIDFQFSRAVAGDN